MAKLSTRPIRVVFWTVAKLGGSSQVAIKFNDLPPVVMGAEEARELAAAVNAELEEVPPVQPVGII